LERGYTVNATVRDPNDEEKVGHLKAFFRADKSLHLFAAGLDDPKAFEPVFKDVQIVLHMASPVVVGKDAGEDDYVKPAVEGTKHVYDAIAKVGSSVKVIVHTSSIAAISSNGGSLSPNHVFSEDDWSDIDRVREGKNWYALSKTLAEKAAWDHEIVKSGKVKLVTVNPGFVIGRITSKKHTSGSPKKWVDALNGEWKAIPNRGTNIVDVYDVAVAHIRAFEDPEAEGRYAVVAGTFSHKEVVDAFHRVGTFSKLPKEVEDKKYEQGDLWNTRKTEKLIGGYKSLDQTAHAMAESYKSLGVI